MNIVEAFKALEEGRRIRRRPWDSDAYLFIKDGRLRSCVWDSFFGEWFSEDASLHIHDVMANDWEVAND